MPRVVSIQWAESGGHVVPGGLPCLTGSPSNAMLSATLCGMSDYSQTKTNMFVSMQWADFHAELAEGAEKKVFPPRSPRPPRVNCLGLEVGGCAASFSKRSLGKRPLYCLSESFMFATILGVARAFQRVKAETRFLTNFTGWKARATLVAAASVGSLMRRCRV